MKTVKLSNLNPTSFDVSILGKSISEVSYTSDTGVVTVHYTDNTSKTLPTMKPGVIRNLISAQIVDDELILGFDVGSSINLGNVVDIVNSILPPIVGSGVLVDGVTGQHKTLTSTDPNLTISVVDDKLQIDATAAGGGGTVESALTAFTMSEFRETITGSAGIVRVPSTANSFTRRTFNQTVTNLAGVSNVGGIITFQPGTYYIDCNTTTTQTGLSYLCVRKVSDSSVLLRGVAANAAAATAINLQLTMSGYLRFDVATEVEIAHYTELAAAGGIVQTDLVPLFDLEATVASLAIYKTSNVTTTPTAPAPETKPSVVTALEQMATTYGDRVPVERKVFSEVQSAGWRNIVHTGDHVYMMGDYSPFMVKWNVLTDEVEYIAIPELLLNAYWSAVAVGDIIYFIPYSASTVGLYNTTTGQITFNNYGLNLTAGGKWSDAVYCPLTNKIYGIPANATDFLIIDTVNQTATRSSLGLTIPTTSTKFMGGVYADGKIYCIPHAHNAVLVIDTQLNTATSNTYGLTLTDTVKWWGGVYVPSQQKIVGIPYSATDILIIDILAGTAVRSSLGATLTGATKWKTAFGKDINDVVYVYPGASARDVLKIDLASNLATRVPQHTSLPNLGLFNSAVQINYDIYFCNSGYSDNFVKLNLTTQFPTYVNSNRILINHSTNASFLGMVRGGNDVVYTVPAAVYDTYAIDVANDRITRIPPPNPLTLNATSFYDGCADNDGNVWFTPFSAVDLSRIVIPTASGTPREFVGRKQSNLIPIMTSASQDGFIVTASAEVTGNEAYRAFDGGFGITTGATANIWTTAVIAGTKWLQVELPIAKRIHGFRFRNASTAYLIAGTVLGSVDGVDWTTLVTLKQAVPTAWEMSRLYLISDVTEYKYFRVEVTETSTGAAAFAEVMFLQDDVDSTNLYEALYDINSANSPFQQITASSINSATYAAHRVSRQYPPAAVTDGWVSAAVAGPHWLNFNFRSPVRVTSLAAWVLTNEYPGRLVLEGTNDDVTYVPLLDVNVALPTVVYADVGEFHFENANAYLSYRLTVYAASTNGVRLGKVSLRTPEQYDASNWWGRWEIVRWPGMASLAGATKWASAARDPRDGKLYLIPHSATDLGIIDPVEETFVRTTWGQPGLVGTGKFIGGAFSPWDGKLYAVPFITSIGPAIFDTENEKYALGYISSNLGQVFSNSYCTLGADGNIHFSARSQATAATVIGQYGTITASLVDHVNGNEKYRGISLGPNGKLYQIPYAKNTYGEIDVTDYTVTELPTLDTSTSTYAVASALISNGNIVVGKYGSGTAVNKACFYVLDFGEGITIPNEIINHPSVR